ncbi:medium-chain acyl-CoA ligase ACSF2, mitochondrial [Caerostris extrusa]|uniref:Medium-chain acyl-CoA ligase ACSF2, mitochondrial n=1 Tax=Caerostris extrusa TaxID=172846 RepID=A0AAV4MQY9_CAEEX|nr:medium-chain acyl-CoA ligase ACSF2, mitochondrial [Caerostris extrusa]
MPGDIPLSSLTVSKLLDETVDKCGDRIAFISVHQGISKSYTDFRHEVAKLASGFISLGLRKGDRIGLCCPNCYEWPLTQYAAAKAGLILVNINPVSEPMELDYCLKKVGCKALVTWDIFKTQNFYNILCEIIPELSKSTSCRLKSSNGILNISDVIESGNKESDEILSSIEKSIQFDDPVNIQYTSGTTGKPKGAVISHHNIINNVLITCKNRLSSAEPSLTKLRCLHPSLFLPGVSVVITPHYISVPVHSYLRNPTMLIDCLNSLQLQKYDISSLNQVIIGGSAITENLLKDLKNLLKLSTVTAAYGSTENGPVVAVNGVDENFEKASKDF